jgi:phosphoribosylformylglycinamidine synthase
MKKIEDNNQIALFYCNKNGEVSEKLNPNGASKVLRAYLIKKKTY